MEVEFGGGALGGEYQPGIEPGTGTTIMGTLPGTPWYDYLTKTWYYMLSTGETAVLPGYITPPIPASGLEPSVPWQHPPGPKYKFLPYLLGGMLAIAAAPVVYQAIRSGSRGKQAARDDKMASAFETSSNRAVSLLSVMAPVLAMPIMYISVDELENRGIISGHLGDTVQLLIGTMAAGNVIQGVSGIISSVIKAVV